MMRPIHFGGEITHIDVDVEIVSGVPDRGIVTRPRRRNLPTEIGSSRSCGEDEGGADPEG
jgi:hypothetical protein